MRIKPPQIAVSLIILILLGMQFFAIDKSVPETPEYLDFTNIHPPSAEVDQLLKQTCYDCHSYQTAYPWYSNVAPVSWWLQSHIDEGREEMNFSTWAQLTDGKADHKLEEAIEKIDEGEMPLPSYTWGHPEARLDEQQKKLLTDWFNEIRGLYNSDGTRSHEEEEHKEG